MKSTASQLVNAQNVSFGVRFRFSNELSAEERASISSRNNLLKSLETYNNSHVLKLGGCLDIGKIMSAATDSLRVSIVQNLLLRHQSMPILNISTESILKILQNPQEYKFVHNISNKLKHFCNEKRKF